MNNKTKKYVSAVAIGIITVIFILLGIRPMIVMSGSMEPDIKTGSLVFVNTKAEFSKIRVNDVITYRLLDSYITHRVTEITEHGLKTKGDANGTEDFGIITEKNFYGKKTGYIPYAGYILFYLKKNLILIIAAVITVDLSCKSARYALHKLEVFK